MSEKTSKSGGTKSCCVVNCSSVSWRDKVSFFRVIRKGFKEQTDAWIAAIHRINPDGTPWIPTEHTRICSAHFVTGKPDLSKTHPDWCPSIFPTNHHRAATKSDQDRFERRHSRRRDLPTTREEPKLPTAIEIGCQTDPDFIGKPFNNFCSGMKEKDGICEAWTQVDSIVTIARTTETTETFHQDLKNKATLTDKNDNCMVTDQVFNSDEKCRAMCGISLNLLKQTQKTLHGMFPKSPVLSADDQLVLYFVKIKTGLAMINVGTMFGIYKKTASKTFAHVLQIHFNFAKAHLWWLTKQEIQATMPESFKGKYSDTRVIIDASEIKIQIPSSVSSSVLCYSSYKSNHTIKFLIGIAPCGLITFMSRAFGGRVTDAQITTQSGLLELLEPGDVVMADKGFPLIERHLMEKNSFLIMPPKHTGKRQFEEHENKETYAIASVRIHVERAIARMKRFGVLKFMENSLLKHANMILISIAYLCNNMEPLIREKKTEEPPDIDLEQEFEENGIQVCECGDCGH